MTEYKIQKSTLDGIANAINAKTGGTAPIDAADMADAIEGIPSGGGGSVKHGVFFLDYDGSVVEAWATDTVASKTALPDNPSHTGLIAQGWNWDLQHIKDYIAAYENVDVYVGQMYETVSGLTEMDITVTKATGLTVTCKMVGNKDWGDGTTDALTEHTYADYGDYTITCDGTSIPSGTSTVGGMFYSGSSNVNKYWCTAIRIGKKVGRLSNYAFHLCYSLTSITIPQGIASIGTNTFKSCKALTSVTIPNGIIEIGISVFNYCGSLTSISIPQSCKTLGHDIFSYCDFLTNVTIPHGITSIGSKAFYSCKSLTNVTIPQNVTNINADTFNTCGSLTNVTIPQSVTSFGDSAFFGCISLRICDFTAATDVPTLSNIYAFNNINAGLCKIIVPDALYDDWIVATNWVTYADYIYKASEVAA